MMADPLLTVVPSESFLMSQTFCGVASVRLPGNIILFLFINSSQLLQHVVDDYSLSSY